MDKNFIWGVVVGLLIGYAVRHYQASKTGA